MLEVCQAWLIGPLPDALQRMLDAAAQTTCIDWLLFTNAEDSAIC